MCRQIRLLLLLTSACFTGAIGSMAMAEPTCSSHPVVVPMELHNNLIFVPVQVNGSGPHSFLVDTGASESFLNTQLASSLGFGSKQHKTNIGAGESSTNIGSAKGVALSLSGIDLPAESVAVIPLAGIEAKIGFKIEGIVGAELFRRYVVTIDYGAKQLSLCEPGKFDDENHSDALTLRLSGNRPFIHAQITSLNGARIDGEFAIDTGDTSTITFHSPFVEKYALRSSGQTFVPHVSTGLSGDSRSWRGRLQSVLLGKFDIDRPTVTFSEATRGSESDASYSGIIGGEILGRFRMTLDYSRHRMLLDPNVRFNDRFDDDMSGATLAASGPELRTVTIVNLIENSAAAQAGIKVNDILETIDGTPVAEMTLPQIKEMFRHDGAVYSLGIRRNDQAVPIQLTLRRII